MRGLVWVAAAALLASCGSPKTPQTADAVQISTARATLHRFVERSQYSGTLVASRSVTVGANATGRLSSVPVRVGDRVEAGEVLATIDASAYAAALGQARGAYAAASSAVSVARASLAQAQARERLAEATAARDASLYQTGDVSRQHYDETQAALQTARAAVAQAQASIASASGAASQAAASIDVAAVPLGDTVIRAPFSGIVTERAVDAGAVVNAGAPVVSMEDDRSLEAEVSVPEELAATIVPGTSVRVEVDALQATVDGRVRAIVPSANATLHTAAVRVALDSHPGLMRGMFVRVPFTLGAGEHVAVPSQALATRAGQTGVFEVQNGRAVFVPVETGQSSIDWVSVTGIPAGATVVLRGVDRLDDGTPVALR